MEENNKNVLHLQPSPLQSGLFEIEVGTWIDTDKLGLTKSMFLSTKTWTSLNLI